MANTNIIKKHRGQGMPKKKPSKATINRLLSYLKEYKKRFLLVLVCIIFSAIGTVAGSIFLRILVDEYIAPLMLSADPEFSGLFKAILVMAGIYLFGIVSAFLYNRLMVTISQGILKTIRNQLFAHMENLPIKYFDTHTHGDIMSHYTNDIDTLRQMLSQSIPSVFSTLVTITAVLFAMIYTNIYLTIFVLGFIYIIMKISRKIGGKSSNFFIKQQTSLGAINGYIEEMINGQKVIKVFCYEDKSKEKFDKLNEDLYENASQANKFVNILMPIIMNLGNLQYIFIAILGGLLAINGVGGLTLGGILSFLNLSKSFTQPLNQVSQQMNFIVMALAGAERIFKLMDEDVESDNGEVTLVNAKFDKNNNLCEADGKTGLWAWKQPHKNGTASYTKVQGDVRFSNVQFGYTDEKIVLQDISLFAQPGQKVAFVGATGAGKTTITNLINRFYDIADGQITYDGIDITQISKNSLRRSLGIVLQDVNLFTGTVMDNIRYGNLEATDEECVKAAKIANAHDFISMLPNGYETILEGNASGLSQGQIQLISIARAAVADPPVLILDEATSSIDTRTESIVQKGMDSLMHGRTVFVIAHRLSTIRNSDVIMVMEQGRIIERGSHEQLINEQGKYYQLYTGAFELE